MSVPAVACIFENTAPLGVERDVLLAALQELIDTHVGKWWGVACKLLRGDLHPPQAGQLPFYFLDDADQAKTLGCHTVDAGRPKAFVFVNTALKNGDTPSEVAGHELIEALVDLYCDLVVLSPRGRPIGLEPADPTQGATFEVRGVKMPNFALPAWYGRANPQGVRGFDYMGFCREAWEIRPQGYVPYWDGEKWSSLFGSKEVKQKHQAADHRLHRSHRRGCRKGRGRVCTLA